MSHLERLVINIWLFSFLNFWFILTILVIIVHITTRLILVKVILINTHYLFFFNIILFWLVVIVLSFTALWTRNSITISEKHFLIIINLSSPWVFSRFLSGTYSFIIVIEWGIHIVLRDLILSVSIVILIMILLLLFLYLLWFIIVIKKI